MTTIEDVGTVIHVLRVIQGLSQGDLAEASGVRNSSISNYERGKATPKLETLQKLAGGMGLSLSVVQETQEFIHRIRSQARLGGPPVGETTARALTGDGSEGDRLDLQSLLAEMDQLGNEAGRLVSRLMRVVLQILAAEVLERPGAPEKPAGPSPASGPSTSASR